MQHFEFSCFKSSITSDGFRHTVREFRIVVTEFESLPDFSKKETSNRKHLRSRLRANLYKSPSTTIKLPIGTKFNENFGLKLPRIRCCVLVVPSRF
jgi:hypothetical protein